MRIYVSAWGVPSSKKRIVLVNVRVLFKQWIKGLRNRFEITQWPKDWSTNA
jgi:hypothetical protein